MSIPNDPVITGVHIYPSYSSGFTFEWEIAEDFSAPDPWKFYVQQAPSPSGEWEDISPVIENKFIWKEDKRPRTNKSVVLYFRIKMVVGKDTYYSDAYTPYGDLSKKEFLIARDIMRREILHASQMAGVETQVYINSNWGPRCEKCLDPITGMVRDSNCKYCLGTGRDPAYHGPYFMWTVYSGDTNHTYQEKDGGLGNVEPKAFQIRAIGSPVLKKNDVVVDIRTDKRYYIDKVDIVAELRRIPVVQSLTVHEAPVTDIIYKLGHE